MLVHGHLPGRERVVLEVSFLEKGHPREEVLGNGDIVEEVVVEVQGMYPG